MRSCGIWREREKLVAVLVSDAGRVSQPMRVPRSETAALASHLVVVEDAEIVIPDSLLRDSIGRAAAATGRLWIAPTPLVESIRAAGALSARGTAAMLARLPRVATLRTQLHKYGSDPRQLRLL